MEYFPYWKKHQILILIGTFILNWNSTDKKGYYIFESTRLAIHLPT